MNVERVSGSSRNGKSFQISTSIVLGAAAVFGLTFAPVSAEAKPKNWPSSWAEEPLAKSPTPNDPRRHYDDRWYGGGSYYPPNYPYPPSYPPRNPGGLSPQVIRLAHSLDQSAQQLRYSMAQNHGYRISSDLRRAAERFADSADELVDRIGDRRFSRTDISRRLEGLSDRARDLDRRIDRERYLSPHLRRQWSDTRYYLSSLTSAFYARGYDNDWYGSRPGGGWGYNDPWGGYYPPASPWGHRR